MNWYIAKLVFQIINNSETQQFDEQLRLIQASDYSEAFANAEAIGAKEEDDFLNSDNQRVVWKFQAITHLFEITNLENGAELCSQIIEKKPNERYLESIKLKHQEIAANLVEAF